MSVIIYTLLSVFIVSIISFVGVLTLSFEVKRLRRILIYLISFSAGALFGDVFIHLLPELVNEEGLSLSASVTLLGGIVVFFILEKIVHWQHCHMPVSKEHIHPFAYTNLVGDGLHNFIDGLIIAGAYMANIPTGIATTVAVILHEIPQEIGDFGVLLHGGFKKRRALLVNFISALFAVVGAVVALWLSGIVEGLTQFLVPLAAGGFIYIAGSDLIPELHKDGHNGWRSFVQVLVFILGIVIMGLLLFVG